MVEASEHSTYLGLPNILGRNKSAVLGYLKDKVNSRIRSWDGNFISRAGKEILVKQVAQALPVYAINVFLLPLEITRNIEKCLTKYWWNSGQTNNSKIIWMNWERLSNHKNHGGMGFRNFRDFNNAMLANQLWRLATNPQSLVSRVYKARYFDKTDVLRAEQGHNPSFIWRSLMEAQQVLRQGMRWRVGNGKSIQILDQPWLLTTENPYITTTTAALQGHTVDSLMCMDRMEWDLDVVAGVLNE
ncbi:putative mitochondrial protein AtMg00310 [Apium graveolens]|uniref:putative mitochondrial protein AtMg00310 n=1 Tax=Apium graveolens TaxID=4045 RepID=UPI003D7B9E07